MQQRDSPVASATRVRSQLPRDAEGHKSSCRPVAPPSDDRPVAPRTTPHADGMVAALRLYRAATGSQVRSYSEPTQREPPTLIEHTPNSHRQERSRPLPTHCRGGVEWPGFVATHEKTREDSSYPFTAYAASCAGGENVTT